MTEEIIRQAMEALQLTDFSRMIIHANQENVYRSYPYRQLPEELGFIPSMSRKANCYDNAMIKCFSITKSRISVSFSYAIR